MPILVTGAASPIGFSICHALRADGHEVRVPLPESESAHAGRLAAALAEMGCEVVAADERVPETLPRHFFKVERLLLHLPPSPEMPRLEREILQVARDVSKPQVVKLSSPAAGAEAPLTLGQQHVEGETALRTSGLRWTVLQPTSLMHNFLLMRRAITEEGEVRLPLDDAAVSFVDLRDVVQVAVKALTNPGHHEHIYPLTGREALTGHDIAAVFARQLDRPVVYRSLSEAAAREGMRHAGLAPWLIDALTDLFARYRDGWGARTTATVAQVTNRNPRRFAEFVADYFGTA